MVTKGTTTLEVHEAGFDGTVTIEDGTVRVTGTRPQDGAAVVKDVPADRDPELTRLVERAIGGDTGVAGQLLAHVGVTDPV
ncbi:hypothetical protein ACI799_06285 [Blastococcus sp. SYSU DS0753]